VTAASQVSPFRAHGNHYIQANIVFPVDADQCVSSRGKPYICTALGRAMFVPSFSNNRHNRCTAARFRDHCGVSPGSLSKAAPRLVSIDCILRIWHVSEITYLNMLRQLLQYLKTKCFIVLQSLKIGTF
jgi:hypothetical protein